MMIFLGIICAIGLGLIAISLVLKRHLKSREWKYLAFLAFAVFPVLYAFGVMKQDMNSMKQVDFCGSCHVMTPYVASLTFDDDEPLSSVHFRNNYVPQETACYSCHTSYAMFGGVKAKAQGLRHVWVYLTDSEKDSIALYEPYDNDNCLHCHGSSERFQKNKKHLKEENFLEKVLSGEKSCLFAGCHDMGHYLGSEDSESEEDW